MVLRNRVNAKEPNNTKTMYERILRILLHTNVAYVAAGVIK